MELDNAYLFKMLLNLEVINLGMVLLIKRGEHQKGGEK